VHPRVAALKFDEEVRRLKQQRDALQARGIFLCGEPSPYKVDLVLVPRHHLQVSLPTQQTGMILLPQPVFRDMALPSLSARAVKARFDLAEYDLRAPSLQFLDPWTNEPLPYQSLLWAHDFGAVTKKPQLVMIEQHPALKRPFLCIRGLREYHEHPQHSGDDWLLYRCQTNLFSIVMAVWRVMLDITYAALKLQGGFNIEWRAQEKP
jgi:hypothetical protein